MATAIRIRALGELWNFDSFVMTSMAAIASFQTSPSPFSFQYGLRCFSNVDGVSHKIHVAVFDSPEAGSHASKDCDPAQAIFAKAESSSR